MVVDIKKVIYYDRKYIFLFFFSISISTLQNVLSEVTSHSVNLFVPPPPYTIRVILFDYLLALIVVVEYTIIIL